MILQKDGVTVCDAKGNPLKFGAKLPEATIVSMLGEGQYTWIKEGGGSAIDGDEKLDSLKVTDPLEREDYKAIVARGQQFVKDINEWLTRNKVYVQGTKKLVNHGIYIGNIVPDKKIGK